jgi:microcystin synthetase protein McyE
MYYIDHNEKSITSIHIQTIPPSMNNISIYNGQELIIACAAAEILPIPQTPKATQFQAVTSGKEALMMAQLQSLKDLKDLHEKTIIKQLEILQSVGITPNIITEKPIIQTEIIPSQNYQIETVSPAQREQTKLPQKPSSPSLNPLALKLNESKSLTEKQQDFINNLQTIYNQKTAKSKAKN